MKVRFELPALGALWAVVDCPHCKGTGDCRHIDTVVCCQCEGVSEVWEPIDWMWNLARAIAVGCALTASFAAGETYGYDVEREGRRHPVTAWKPLCGRPFTLL